MLSAALTKALTTQIGVEIYASNLYLAAAMLARSEGCAKLCELYLRNSAEEKEHADKIAGFVAKRGEQVSVPAIESVGKPKDLLAALTAALAQEEKVTAALSDLQIKAESEKDRLTCAFMQTMLEDQVEGEDQARRVLAFYRGAGDIVTFDQQVAVLL